MSIIFMLSKLRNFVSDKNISIRNLIIEPIIEEKYCVVDFHFIFQLISLPPV